MLILRLGRLRLCFDRGAARDLYHYYEIDGRGVITKANIVTPTAHNFLNLEESLKKLVTENIDKPEDELIFMCEMLVRAYDPCFSCSVH